MHQLLVSALKILCQVWQGYSTGTCIQTSGGMFELHAHLCSVLQSSLQFAIVSLTLMFGNRNCRKNMTIKLIPSKSCKAHAQVVDLKTSQTATMATDRPKLEIAWTGTLPIGGWTA